MSTYYILADINLKTGKTTYHQAELKCMPFGVVIEESVGFIPSYES